MIHAASGGVGHFAVQIAKYLGAHVVATSSGKNENFVTGLGADRFINYKSTPFEEKVEAMDIVVDSINDIDHVLRSINVIKRGGRLVYLQPHFKEGLEAKMEERDIKGESVFVQSSGEIL